MRFRDVVIVGCAAAAALALYMGGRTVVDDWETQLFWLAFNVVLVTFAIQALVSRDLERRRRRDLTLGFQSHTAMLADELPTLVKAGPKPIPEPARSAIGTAPDHFASNLLPVAEYIRRASEIHADRYDAVYGTISGLLNDLGRGFLRLFSKDGDAMVENHRKIVQLAQRWRYETYLWPGTLRRYSELPPEDPEVASIDAARREALQLLRETGAELQTILDQSRGPLMELAP